jgi:5-methylcytosine-specific restriction endonuclease McrA
MPYKSLKVRRRRYRKRRATDSKWVRRYRAYQREYQKKWRRRNLEKIRAYNRKYARLWRSKNARHFRKTQALWRRRNRNRVRALNKKWYKQFGKAWYRQNRSKRRQQAKRQYRKERRYRLEQQKARRRRYYWKNRDWINEKRRGQRVLNPQFFRNADKVRYLKHRIRRIIFQRNIQARRIGAVGQVTPEQWQLLLKRHRFSCFYCGTKLQPANRTLDHKIPLSRGGRNTINNVVPACRPCNQRKMRMTTKEFLARIKRIQKFQ